MHSIYYKSSEGVVVNLIEAPYRMLTETDLLNNEWKWETVGTNFPKITALKKEIVSPPFSIRITGTSKEDMLNNLEYIEGVFDRDCFLNQMGRLYIGDFYRECFITSSNKGKVFEKTHTVVEFVATSNDGFWKNDKNFELSGQGMPTGEIAYTVSVTATPNNDTLIWSANDDKTANIEWDGGDFDGQDKILEFDLGTTTDIGEFSGLHITADARPKTCKVQTWDGTSYDDTSTGTYINTPQTTSPYYSWRSNMITIGQISKIVIDETSDWDSSIFNFTMVGHRTVGSETEITIIDSNVNLLGEDIDVSEFEWIIFEVQATENISPMTTNISYTTYAKDWQDIESYFIQNETKEITAEDFTARYFRVYSQTSLGEIDDTISIFSGEPVQERDLFKYGYSLDNVEVIQVSEGVLNYRLIDARKSGTLLFDARSVVLKEITSAPHSVSDGIIIISGENDGTWTKICDLESDSAIDWTYNDHYDKIKISFVPNQQDHFVSATHFSIMAEADPKIYNESYAPSDAIITIYGARNNPQISINGNVYGSSEPLSSGEKLVIDTNEKTVRKYTDDYTYENVFASRTEGAFEKIESGENDVYWDGQQHIDITLIQARSTPKWN